MNSRNEMKVKRDVSCTSTLHYRELRGAGPNPLDFRTAMEEIRGKTASLFLSLPHACYSPPALRRLILMCVEILICFNMKRLQELAHGYITETTWARTQKENVQQDKASVTYSSLADDFLPRFNTCRMKQPLITGHVAEFI